MTIASDNLGESQINSRRDGSISKFIILNYLKRWDYETKKILKEDKKPIG